MKSNADVEKNLSNKGNSKNFRKGTEPETYGEGAEAKNYGGDEVDYGNIVGATPDPNTDKGKVYEKRMVTPREPVLNAVPMPNHSKANKKDYGVLKVKDDAPANQKWAGGNQPIGGTPMPNNIR